MSSTFKKIILLFSILSNTNIAKGPTTTQATNSSTLGEPCGTVNIDCPGLKGCLCTPCLDGTSNQYGCCGQCTWEFDPQMQLECSSIQPRHRICSNTCCDPIDITPACEREVCSCCADGTWTGSHGDGRTFTCGDQTLVKGVDDDQFGDICTSMPTTTPTLDPTTKTPTLYPTTSIPTSVSIIANKPTDPNINSMEVTDEMGNKLSGELKNKDENNVFGNSVIIIFVIGCVGLCLVIFVVWFMWNKKRKNTTTNGDAIQMNATKHDLKRVTSDTPTTPMNGAETATETEVIINKSDSVGNVDNIEESVSGMYMNNTDVTPQNEHDNDDDMDDDSENNTDNEMYVNNDTNVMTQNGEVDNKNEMDSANVTPQDDKDTQEDENMYAKPMQNKTTRN